MSYSIKPILHQTAGKNGLHKIQILVIYKRMRFVLKTHYRVQANQFKDGRVKGYVHANDLNRNLVFLVNKYEKILLNAIDSKADKETINKLFKDEPPPIDEEPASNISFADYTKELIDRFKNKFGRARLIHYNTLAEQIRMFNDIKLKDINTKEATLIEKHLRSLGFAENTLNTKMKIFIAIINQAKLEKLVSGDCLLGYKKPRYVDPIPDFLTEDEIQVFKNVVDATTPTRYKVAGYYFLLSCFTGYRISDLQKFNYDKAVIGNKILIRARKNKQAVVIMIYPALAEILEQVKQYSFYFTEQSMRKYVKEIALIAGLNRKIKIHTARHTFAIMLLNKGFTVDEVAELLGDSKNVARIYARVMNKQLDKAVKEKLF